MAAFVAAIDSVAAIASTAPAAAEVVREFDVAPQSVYELRLKTGRVPDGAMARLVFLNADGADVAPVEASLGFAQSGGVAALPRHGGETVIVSAAGNGTVKAIRALVEIDGADKSTVRACSLEPFDAGEDPSHTSGLDLAMTGNGNFARNLAQNPSFEEEDGWNWLGGDGGGASFRFSGDSYTGARSVALGPATDEAGVLTSAPFPIDPAAPLHYSYAMRCSRVAKPHGHANPVRLEFLAAGEDGDELRPVATDSREFDYRRHGRLLGEWTPVTVRDVRIPPAATHARVIVEHRDIASIWSGEVTAGWGTLLIDDIAVWQGGGLPPQLPIGKRRDNSVAVTQDAFRDGALFFDGDAATLSLRVENLLGWNRTLSMRCVVSDCRMERVGEPSALSFALSPFNSATIDLPLPDTPRYGAYQIECEIVEDGAGTVCRVRCPFARIAHPSWATAQDKVSGHYPFDMHPTAISFNGAGPPGVGEFEAKMMERLGVRGVRLQARYAKFGLSRKSWEDCANDQLEEVASRAVETFRRDVKPLLDGHGIRGWVSLMEQERANPAGAVKTPGQLCKWERFHECFARALGNDVDFILFGNEGVGGYTAHLGGDDNLFPLSGFTGTTREWIALASHAMTGLSKGNPALPIGVSHANDRAAAIARRYLKAGAVHADCWGCNSYTSPHINAPTICKAFDEAGASLDFFVIPELGERAASPSGHDAAAHTMVCQYAQTLSREPRTRHICWFAFSYGDFGAFDPSGGGARATAAAYAVMTDTLRAGRAGEETPLTGGAFIPWRRLDGTSVAVAWSSSGQEVAFAVPHGAPLVESDIYGNQKQHASKNGRVEVTIGPVAYYWIDGAAQEAPSFAPGCVPVDRERVRRERIRAALSAARAAGSDNLVRNASFEGNGMTLPLEWKFEATVGDSGARLTDCRFTREEGMGPDGVTALLIDNRVKDLLKSGAHPVIWQDVPVEEGATYAFRVLVKKARTGQWVQPQIDLLDADGTVARSLPTPEPTDRDGEWDIRETDFTVHNGEAAARILLKGNHGGAGADYFARPELRKIN